MCVCNLGSFSVYYIYIFASSIQSQSRFTDDDADADGDVLSFRAIKKEQKGMVHT